MDIILSTIGIYAVITLLCTSAVFVIAQLKNDNSIMDIAYGPTFLVATLLTITLTEGQTAMTALVSSLVALWSARLGIRILRKNASKPEDARYAAWRTSWSERGQLYFVLRSYLQIFILQGLIITIVSLPIIWTITYANLTPSLTIAVGTIIFLFGLIYESIADAQLDAFIRRKKAGAETADLMTSGLFHYSRRPNYFGEATLWWGLGFIALGLPYGFIALIGPLLITFIVTRVTGPMLEEIFLEKYPEQYRAYMKTTSYFLPLPKKRSE